MRFWKFCATVMLTSVLYCQTAETLLFEAVDASNQDTAIALIKSGAKIDGRDKSGATLLYNAIGCEGYGCSHRCLDKVIALLLERGADPNSASMTWKWTPLHRIVDSSCGVTVAELLVSKGANVNAKDASDKTPLMCAAEKGKDEMLKLLIGKKADLSLQDKDGRTALSYAARGGKPSTVEILKAAVSR